MIAHGKTKKESEDLKSCTASASSNSHRKSWEQCQLHVGKRWRSAGLLRRERVGKTILLLFRRCSGSRFLFIVHFSLLCALLPLSHTLSVLRCSPFGNKTFCSNRKLSNMPSSSGRTSSSSRSRSEPRASSQPRASSSTRGTVSPFARRDNPPPYVPEGGSWPRRNPASPERVRFTGGFPSNPQVPDTYGTAPPGSRERDDRYRNDLRERGIEKKGNYSKSHEDYKDAELHGEIAKGRYSEHMGTARIPPSREDRRGDPRGAWTGQPLEKPSWHGTAAPLAGDVASAYGK